MHFVQTFPSYNLKCKLPNSRNSTAGFASLALLTFWTKLFIVRDVLCIVGCLAVVSLAYPLGASSSTPFPPNTHPWSCDNQKHLQILSHVPLGAKSPLVENHCTV